MASGRRLDRARRPGPGREGDHLALPGRGQARAGVRLGPVAGGGDLGLHVRRTRSRQGRRASGPVATSATATTASSTASPGRSAWNRPGRSGSRARSATGSRPTLRSRQAASDPVAGSAEAFGFGGTTRVMPLVRRAVAASGDSPSPARPADPAAVDAAAGVLGATWPRLVEMLGVDLARGVFAEAVHRAAMSIVASPAGRRDALQAMQPGQWDVLSPVLAASRDVFGGFIWRHRRDRSAREAQVDARLEIARSAGPWWALDGLAIVSERPLVFRADDRGRPHSAGWAGHRVGRRPRGVRLARRGSRAVDHQGAGPDHRRGRSTRSRTSRSAESSSSASERSASSERVVPSSSPRTRSADCGGARSRSRGAGFGPRSRS